MSYQDFVAYLEVLEQYFDWERDVESVVDVDFSEAPSRELACAYLDLMVTRITTCECAQERMADAILDFLFDGAVEVSRKYTITTVKELYEYIVS